MKPVLYPSNDVPSLTWAEIDLGALAHNYRELRRVTRSSATMMAVVKADGYGHGAPQVAGVALENGAEFLAVARLNEAIMLREAGISAPILLFGHSLPDYVGILDSQNIWAALNTLESAHCISAEFWTLRIFGQPSIHWKVLTVFQLKPYVVKQLSKPT